jgi:leucine dehydrogenase
LNSLQAFAHERVDIITGSRSGLTMIVAVHNTHLGPALGGCRLWSYPSWQDALDDSLRLSSGMTAKNALAGLSAGGGKTVIDIPSGMALDVQQRRDIFLDVGDAVELLDGRYRTAEDVGTTSFDMTVIRERTMHVVGLPAELGGLGDPGEYTARGVLSSLHAALEWMTGSPSLSGRRITIAGLGAVGSRLARALAEDNAILTITDLNPARASLAEELGAGWCDVSEAHRVPADVFMPAGVGGMLTDAVIDELAAFAVVGPANNQLAQADGAERLADRGILYAPDYLVNAGGVIYLGAQSESDPDRSAVLDRIDGIGVTLTSILQTAKDKGITTLEAADAIVNQLLNVGD